MKKILSILLAVSLIMALALTVSAAETTVTKQMSSFGWTNGTQYKTAALDDVITATVTGNSNTGKYYTSDSTWRLYQNENAKVTIAANGATIQTVKITFNLKDSGQLMNGSTTVTSNSVITVGAPSITLSVGGTGTNGKVFITAIQVVYTTDSGSGSTPTPCEHEYTNEYDATCDKCADGDRTVSLPAAESVITYAQAQKLYDAGVTNTIYKVTGEIKSVTNTQYGNMYIKDAEGNEFCIYGLYSGETRYDAMTVKPIVGDTITASGKLTAYKGVAQIGDAQLVEHTPAERDECTEHAYTNEYDATCNNAGCTTGNREVTLPEADSELTFEVAEKICAAQDHNTFTTTKYYLTGKIIEITSEQYGNMKIEDEAGNVITLYGTWSADGSEGYADMEKKPAVGDTITVYGVLGRYNSTMQMKNGWIQEEPASTADNTPVVALITLCVLSAAAFVTMTSLKKREF